MSATIATPEGAVGRSIPRIEDQRLLTGNGSYVSDLVLPRMQHVAFLRSPHGHAKITGIDHSRVNVREHTVFTGEMPMFAGMGLRAQSALPSYVETIQPPLAKDKVRFAGEPVAAVVSRNRYTAEDAVESIAVGYEVLPATVTAWIPPVVPVHDQAPDNVLLERVFDAGDVGAAFARSEVVVEREFITNRHAGNPMECRAGVALWDAAVEKLTFWSGTQVPHLVRNMLAELLGLSESNVRVIAPDVGGGFGVKSILYPEDLALCLMARELRGIPLKWVEDRSEHLQAAAHARDHRYLAKAGFAADGTLLALEADVTCNIGAYSVYPWTAGIEPLMAGGLLSGPYQLENYRCTTRGVTTNTAYAGPYRGVARPSTVFVMESLLNLAGKQLGITDLDMRRKNLITPDMIPYRMPSRLIDDSGWYGECLENCVDEIGYEAFLAEQTRRRESGENPIGIGFACYNELTGLGRAASAGPRMPFRTGHDACTTRMEADGTVTVLSGVTDQGQGLSTTMAQIVADAVGVDFEEVTVRIGDTNEALWGFGAFSSRQAVIGGGAAHRSGEALREKVLNLAAALFDKEVAALTITQGKIIDSNTQEPVTTVADVARVAYLESNRLPEGFEPGLQATSFYDPIRGAFAAGAQAAVIEVDRDSGALKILKWVCSEDAGRAINPKIVDGQILGAIAQGIGGTMYEHLIYDEAGNLTTGTLMDYLMPTTHEIPDMTIIHVEHPANNPVGVRGVGEGGTLGPNAVITGAIHNALGLELTSLPVTPAAVWGGLNA
ncbi:xanthine dehydrogenase family protein molybdopterin-binding subunit [Paeniglutamicibacter sp. ZC-3]|uniref:xanthine dehydrogenase family protein molybdopterin-binding subunit n=1 Tax=Paeniglutamicibacter sp. ZC-3 TaxID=2986919 RepID=UPI0021F6DA0E|nr:xanthine dehydrogenase family protein molybdopterin-binding subunit [Paeniglutamicibacter sp. ZC-3]MCV9994301.1 xanthine dehydrogenase family protein molybdopterin-binding subunit [Paeniglutamicibacter sp. ZC-3]